MNYRKTVTVASTISADGRIKSGGTNVNYGFYSHLSEYFDVKVVFLAPYGRKREIVQISEHLIEIVIPRSAMHNTKQRTLAEQIHTHTLYDIGILYFLDDTPEYYQVLKEEAINSDVIICDRPYLYDAVSMVANGKPIIQKSHNIEFLFRKANIPQNSLGDKILDDLFAIEKKCCLASNLTFSCSQMDSDYMVNNYGIDSNRIKYVANGVDLNEEKYTDLEDRKRLKKIYGITRKLVMFIGGGHVPNVEACKEMIKMAPYCEDVFFVIAGDVCNIISRIKHPNNVILLGNVSEETRKYLFSIADIALNPMRSGSGANVKMIDYMASGIPVISTEFGARGIVDISNIGIADTLDEMIQFINSFEIDEWNQKVTMNRKMVEEIYDWSVVAQNASKYISEIL